jgi:hypothetical protein
MLAYPEDDANQPARVTATTGRGAISSHEPGVPTLVIAGTFHIAPHAGT